MERGRGRGGGGEASASQPRGGRGRNWAGRAYLVVWSSGAEVSGAPLDLTTRNRPAARLGCGRARRDRREAARGGLGLRRSVARRGEGRRTAGAVRICRIELRSHFRPDRDGVDARPGLRPGRRWAERIAGGEGGSARGTRGRLAAIETPRRAQTDARGHGAGPRARPTAARTSSCVRRPGAAAPDGVTKGVPRRRLSRQACPSPPARASRGGAGGKGRGKGEEGGVDRQRRGRARARGQQVAPHRAGGPSRLRRRRWPKTGSEGRAAGGRRRAPRQPPARAGGRSSSAAA